MTRRRPCLDCGTLTRAGSRCPAHQHQHRARYSGSWSTIAKQVIGTYRAAHGDVCPGYRRAPHAIHPSEWCADHDLGALCRARNGVKGATVDTERAIKKLTR